MSLRLGTTYVPSRIGKETKNGVEEAKDSISNEEEAFEDALDEWTMQEENRETTHVKPHDDMNSILEGIDLLVNKEYIVVSSSEEDHRRCEDIREMGLCTHSSCQGSRKAVLSLGVGFHIVLDSKSTPLHLDPKRVKGLGTKEQIPVQIQLDVPSRQPS